MIWHTEFTLVKATVTISRHHQSQFWRHVMMCDLHIFLLISPSNPSWHCLILHSSSAYIQSTLFPLSKQVLSLSTQHAQISDLHWYIISLFHQYLKKICLIYYVYFFTMLFWVSYFFTLYICILVQWLNTFPFIRIYHSLTALEFLFGPTENCYCWSTCHAKLHLSLLTETFTDQSPPR